MRKIEIKKWKIKIKIGKNSTLTTVSNKTHFKITQLYNKTTPIVCPLSFFPLLLPRSRPWEAWCDRCATGPRRPTTAATLEEGDPPSPVPRPPRRRCGDVCQPFKEGGGGGSFDL